MSRNTIDIVVDEDVASWITEHGMPPTLESPLKRTFTKKEDAVILSLWPTTKKDWLAKQLNCCAQTLRKRYYELLEGAENEERHKGIF